MADLEKQIDAALQQTGGSGSREAEIIPLLERWCRMMEQRLTAKQHPALPKPECGFTAGGRYFRVWRKVPGSNSVVAFVDRKSGDVYKPASWKTPAKGVRGNILTSPDEVLSWDYPPYWGR
jgi:hypothetical protein